MATTVTHVVDPNGGAGHDYDSLALWEAGEQGDLTGVRNEIAVAKCQCTGGTADATAVSIDGWTTDATRYCKAWTDPAESYRHNGTYQTGNKYRMEVANVDDYGIIWANEFCVIDGIQVKATSVAVNYSYGIGANVSSTFKNCITLGAAQNTYIWFGIWPGIISQTHYVSNCLSYSTGNNGSSGPASNGSSTAYFYNCIFIGDANTYGFLQDGASGTSYVKNCYSIAASTYCYYTSGATMTLTTCASADSTGTLGLRTIAKNTTNFVNVTGGSENFHLPSGSALVGVGTNLYNDAAYPFQTDIDGQDRGGSGASWDVGMDEYVSSNPTMTISETLSFAEALD